MTGPLHDTRGIIDAPGLFAHVRFRRREPAEPLRRYLENYWLIDGDLPEPYTSYVVPHPAVNVVFQRFGDLPAFGEVAGVGLDLFRQTLHGRVRVCGVKFRPGGYRPFAPDQPVSRWTGLRLPYTKIRANDIVEPDDEDARVAVLDAALLSLQPRPDPQADLAVALLERIRLDRTILRVADLARDEGLSMRSLQRLFAAYVGVSPKWVILRYRIHEALDRAAVDVDWALLAAELGYSDQAHLVRDFTATVGVPPTAYAGS